MFFFSNLKVCINTALGGSKTPELILMKLGMVDYPGSHPT